MHHLHVWAMSTMQNALTAHLVVSPDTDLAAINRIKKTLRRKLEQLHIGHSTFEVETGEKACEEKSCPGETMPQHTHDPS